MNDNAVEDYGWETPTGPHSCGYIAPAVLHLLGRIGAGRVVDIGAGNGALCSMLARSGIYVAGVEYDERGIEIARKNNPGINFYRSGVQDDPHHILSQEGSPFDAAVSTEVVEHLFSPHLLPRFAHALLRDGGQLVVTTPYHGYLKNLVLAMLGKWDKHHTALWHGGHIKFFSKTTLGQLLHENGFEVTGFHGVGRVPYLWKSMILVARKQKSR